MLGFFVVVARGDTSEYALIEGRYYHVDAKSNDDGWFSYRKIDAQFTMIYQYDDKDDIALNHTTSMYIEHNIASLTTFGWTITWKGNVTDEHYLLSLNNPDGEISIDQSFSEADRVSKDFQMKLDSPSYRRFIEDADDRIVVELLTVIDGSGSEFQVYDRYGNKTQWENRDEFNLTDHMVFAVNETNEGEDYVNCTVTTTSDTLNVTVWSEWDVYTPDSPVSGDEPDASKFNVTMTPATPTTYQWCNITLDDDWGFIDFYVYGVSSEGGYRKGDTTATTTAIMFYATGNKVLVLAGQFENGTIVVSEGHSLTVSGEGSASVPDSTGDVTDNGRYNQNIPYYMLIIGGIIAFSLYSGLNRMRPKKDRRKVVTSGSALWGLGLDDDYAPEPLKKEYELLTSKMEDET
jgi:hypothetical protein